MTFIGDRMGRKKVCLATDIYLLFYFDSLFQFILIMLLETVVFGLLGGIPVSDQKAIGYPWLLACRFVLGMAFFLGANWTYVITNNKMMLKIIVVLRC